MLRIRLLSPVLLAASATWLGGPTLAQGLVPVARLRVQVPSADTFTIHGTIPLPAGTWVPGDPTPVKITDHDGTVVDDTQVEVVSRYPGAPDGADVVELIARVSKAPGWSTGAYKTYQVVPSTGAAPPNPGAPDVTDLVTGPNDVPANVQGLVLDPDSVLVVATDPLGNQYAHRLLDPSNAMRTERYGVAQSTLRTYGVLLDAAGPAPNAYPHMMGVHAYVSTFSDEELVSIDLRVNNGGDGSDAADPNDDQLGKVYFEELELLVLFDPVERWLMQQQLEDPYAFRVGVDTPTIKVYGGKTYVAYPLVRPMPAGANQPMHMMPCRSQFHRRLALTPANGEATGRAFLDREGLAFAVRGSSPLGPLWSWWNEDTARYFPQNHRLPRMNYHNSSYGGIPDMRGQLSSWFTDLVDALELNQPFPYGPGTNSGSADEALGWARPLWTPYGGGSGGNGIQHLEGVRTAATASRDGYGFLQARHRLSTERTHNATYGADGDATYVDKWLIPNSTCSNAPNGPTGTPSEIPFTTWLGQGQDDDDFCPSPGWDQNAHVQANMLEPFYDVDPTGWRNLNTYDPHDGAHITRYSGPPMALAWLGNDPIAKDDLRMQSEVLRWDYNEYPVPGCGDHATSVIRDRDEVDTCPSWGFDFFRMKGWGLFLAAGSFAMEDDAWRARMQVWFDRVGSLIEDGAAYMVDPSFVDAGGAPYDLAVVYSTTNPDALDDCNVLYRQRLTFQEEIGLTGIESAAGSVYPPGDPLRATLEDVALKGARSIIAPVAWNEAAHAVHRFLGNSENVCGSPFFNCDPTLGPCDVNTQTPLPACAADGLSSHHLPATMAIAHGHDADDIFLERPLENRLQADSDCLLFGTCASELQTQLQELDPTYVPEYSSWSNIAVLLGHVQ